MAGHVHGLKLLSHAEEQANSQCEAQAEFHKLSVLMPICNHRWTLRQIVARTLSMPTSLELELVAVDDGSEDGSWELLEELAADDPRIKTIRHEHTQGKGTAVRTAIDAMTGDLAVVQEGGLDYDPHDIPALLEPLLAGKADAVFGSRYSSGQVHSFWQSVKNQSLTLLSNLLNNLQLSDTEAAYKVVRADILKQLRLQAKSTTLEAELTCRLAQWGARLYEVPISYYGQSSPANRNGWLWPTLKSLGQMVRCRCWDTRFTPHSGFYILTSMAQANGYNQWILNHVKDFMGTRVLEAGSGIGNLSQLLLNRERLVLIDYEDIYVRALKQRFGRQGNVRVDQADLTTEASYHQWEDERLDTIFCSNVLEHLENDVDVLSYFQQTLVPGGHCVIVVPSGKWLYNGMDEELGHFRRYSPEELANKMAEAGLEVVHTERFSKLGSLAWAWSGHVMRKRHISPSHMLTFERILPIAKLLEYCLPVPGMSLIMVGRKPEGQAQRKVA